MSSTASNSVGVKVEPKFLRDPSTLESISSALYGLSSYVAHNLPSTIASLRKVAGGASGELNNQAFLHQDYLQPQFSGDTDSQSLTVADSISVAKKEVIVYAAFDEIEVIALGAQNNSVKRSVLLLGYPDGFQIWDVSSPDNIHELISIRDSENFGEVSYLKVIPNPQKIPKDSPCENSRPLVALICKPTKSTHQENDEDSDALARPRSVLKFFSLKSHNVVKMMSFENEGTVTCVKCNERAIIVALSNPSRLYVLSTLTLDHTLPPLTDVGSHPITRAPIFSLGPRLLAYATTSQPPERGGKSDGDYLLGEADENNGGTGKYQEVAKDVAKGVAKEVVNGVKLLGDYGYQTISAYFSNGLNPPNPSASSSFPKSMPINIKNGSMSPNSRNSHSPQPSPSNNYYYNPKGGSASSISGDINGNGNAGLENEIIGAIMIRDIGFQTLQNTKLPPVVAHFQPHTHPVGHLSFNPSGTLLFSTSIQGHKFHIFEILGKRRRGGGQKTIKHIYRLSRGLTDASVGEGSVGWSVDSRWCAVASGRGTIHVFAINPYGGPADVPSHVKGWVINSEELYTSSTQSPVVRIKPRNPLPLDPTDPANFPSQSSNQLLPNIFTNDYYSMLQFEQNSSPAAASPMRRPSPLHPNGSSTSSSHNQQQIPYNGALITTNNNIINCPTSDLLRKPPGICLKFLPSLSVDSKSVNFFGGLHANLQRNTKRRSSPSTTINNMIHNNPLSGQSARRERRRTKSWTQNSSPSGKSTSLNYPNFEDEEEEDRFDNIGYQDILSLHPTGILTLHRVWMEGILIRDNGSQSKEEGSNNMIGMTGVPLTGSAAAVANMGRVLVGGAAGVVGMGMEFAGVGRKDAVRPGEPTLGLLVKYEDVVEWNLFRGQNWSEVKNAIESPNPSKDQEITVKKDNSKKWLAHAEIATHTTSRTSLPPPLWLSHQFSFQTYGTGYQESMKKGEVPQAKKLEIKRGVIVEEDGGCSFVGENGCVTNGNRSNRKVATVVVEDGRVVGRGLEDISANISNAMNTVLELNSDKLEAIIPLSFEDAYHVVSPNITTTAASLPPPSSSASMIPDLITLNTPPSSGPSPLMTATTNPNDITRVSQPLTDNNHTHSDSTASSPFDPQPTFSRSSSSASIRTTTSTTAFSEDMEVIQKDFCIEDDVADDASFFFTHDAENVLGSLPLKKEAYQQTTVSCDESVIEILFNRIKSSDL
ncbi:10839_t:CDS:10 [Ambispora gerdemannii]|uniref:10839_t:CDS:1 n=1 Tax=Ambispora gerdemannii TaxID=144530 RepID=A0A9N8ZQJ1_9GLOM|nr:10839_t:CDS:10 [Ambispora gerdemannii]